MSANGAISSQFIQQTYLYYRLFSSELSADQSSSVEWFKLGQIKVDGAQLISWFPPFMTPRLSPPSQVKLNTTNL